MKKLLIGLLFAVSGCQCGHPVDGEKVGHVVKIASEGLLCKTTEGQLVRGSFNGSGGATGNQPFDFTVKNDNDRVLLEQAMRTNKEVSVKYTVPWVATLCSREVHSQGVITAVTILE